MPRPVATFNKFANFGMVAAAVAALAATARFAPAEDAAAPKAPAAAPEALKASAASLSGAPIPEGYDLFFADDFEDGNADGWAPFDPAAFGVVEDGGKKAYAVLQDAKYKPPFRSPENISILRGLDVSDFVIEARLKSTTKDYNHRDMCVVFDYADPSHFYYVHFALVSDPHANSIFRVADAERISIAKTRTNGTRWSEDYHTVRVVRRAGSGEIEIYFDDMTKPAMTAEDKAIGHGSIGVGSFDDTGMIDEVKVWAKK